MPIFDQGYRHFDGKKHGPLHRIWTIGWEGIKLQWPRRKRGWLFWVGFLLMAAVPFFLFASLFFAFAYFQDPSWASWAKGVLNILGEEMADLYFRDPGKLRPFLWSYAFCFYLSYFQIFFVVLVIAAIGPKLISSDLRYEGLHLYFSKPVTIAEYILGKFMVIFAFVLGVAFLPVLALYGISIFFSPDMGAVFLQTYPSLVYSLFMVCFIAVPCGLLMLFFSSLTSSGRFVGFGWVVLWIVTMMASGFIRAKQEVPLIKGLTTKGTLEEKSRLSPDLAKQIKKKTDLDFTKKGEIYGVEGGDRYLILSKGEVYGLRKNKGKLKMTFDKNKKTFTLDGFFEGPLHRKRIPPFLRNEIQAQTEYELTEEATVEEVEKFQKWTIKDGEHTFTFQKEGETFDLYYGSTLPTLISPWHNFSVMANKIYGLVNYLKERFLSPVVRAQIAASFLYTHPWVYSFLVILFISVGSLIGLVWRLRQKM